MPRTVSIATLGLVASLASTTPLAGQQATATSSTALRHEIERADSMMFAAYNTQNGDERARYFTRDLEFFRDTGGLQTWEQMVTGLKSTMVKSPDIRRTLVGAIEVYPIRDYGAIEIGVHQFCHRENGRQECGCACWHTRTPPSRRSSRRAPARSTSTERHYRRATS
jgi:hypothetical protein